MIARSVWIIAIALVLVIGIYGLDHPESHWLQTALGLPVTGMLAQGYALSGSIQTNAAAELLVKIFLARVNKECRQS